MANLADSIGMYFKEIAQIPLLTKQEEMKLLKRIAVGDKEAREALVIANQRLSVSIARRYVNKGVPFLDLIQEGNTGLLKAADKFDLAIGQRFTTYAMHWVRQAIALYIKNNGRIIRVPKGTLEKCERVLSVARELELELGRIPSIEEVAAELQVSEEDVKNLLEVAIGQTVVSMYEDGSDGDWLREVSDPDANTETSAIEGIETRQTNGMLYSALRELILDDAKVIILRNGFHDGKVRSRQDVGKILGCTRERVRQREERAMKTLRNSRIIKQIAKERRVG